MLQLLRLASNTKNSKVKAPSIEQGIVSLVDRARQLHDRFTARRSALAASRLTGTDSATSKSARSGIGTSRSSSSGVEQPLAFEDARGLDLLAPLPPSTFANRSHVLSALDAMSPKIMRSIRSVMQYGVELSKGRRKEDGEGAQETEDPCSTFSKLEVAPSPSLSDGGRTRWITESTSISSDRSSVKQMMLSGQLLEHVSGVASDAKATFGTDEQFPLQRGKRYSWRLVAIAPLAVESVNLVLSLFWFVHSSEMLSVMTARTLALRVAQEGPQGADWTASMRETLQTLVAQSASMRRALHVDEGDEASGPEDPQIRPESALDMVGREYKKLLRHTGAVARAETAAAAQPGAVAAMHDDVLDWVRFVLIRVVLQLFMVLYEGSPSLAEDGPLYPPVLVRRIEAAIDRLTTGPQAGSTGSAKANERCLGSNGVVAGAHGAPGQEGGSSAGQARASGVSSTGAAGRGAASASVGSIAAGGGDAIGSKSFSVSRGLHTKAGGKHMEHASSFAAPASQRIGSSGGVSGSKSDSAAKVQTKEPRLRVAINGKVISDKALWRALSGLNVPKRLAVLHSDDLPELELSASHGGAAYEPRPDARMPPQQGAKRPFQKGNSKDGKVRNAAAGGNADRVSKITAGRKPVVSFSSGASGSGGVVDGTAATPRAKGSGAAEELGSEFVDAKVEDVTAGSGDGSDSDGDSEIPGRKGRKRAAMLKRTASATMQELEEVSGERLAELRKFRSMNRTASGYYPMAPRKSSNRAKDKQGGGADPGTAAAGERGRAGSRSNTPEGERPPSRPRTNAQKRFAGILKATKQILGAFGPSTQHPWDVNLHLTADCRRILLFRANRRSMPAPPLVQLLAAQLRQDMVDFEAIPEVVLSDVVKAPEPRVMLHSASLLQHLAAGQGTAGGTGAAGAEALRLAKRLAVTSRPTQQVFHTVDGTPIDRGLVLAGRRGGLVNAAGLKASRKAKQTTKDELDERVRKWGPLGKYAEVTVPGASEKTDVVSSMMRQHYGESPGVADESLGSRLLQALTAQSVFDTDLRAVVPNDQGDIMHITGGEDFTAGFRDSRFASTGGGGTGAGDGVEGSKDRLGVDSTGKGGKGASGGRAHSFQAPPLVGPQPMGSPLRAVPPVPRRGFVRRGARSTSPTRKQVGFASDRPLPPKRPRRVSVSGKPIPPPPKRPKPPSPSSVAQRIGGQPGAPWSPTLTASQPPAGGGGVLPPMDGLSKGVSSLGADSVAGLASPTMDMAAFDDETTPGRGAASPPFHERAKSHRTFAPPPTTPMRAPGLGQISRSSFSISFSAADLKQHLHHAASVESVPSFHSGDQPLAAAPAKSQGPLRDSSGGPKKLSRSSTSGRAGRRTSSGSVSRHHSVNVQGSTDTTGSGAKRKKARGGAGRQSIVRKKRPSMLVLSQADLRLAVPLTQKERKRMAVNMAATEEMQGSSPPPRRPPRSTTGNPQGHRGGLTTTSAVLERSGSMREVVTSRRRRRASLSLAEPWLNRAVQRRGLMATEGPSIALSAGSGGDETARSTARRSPRRRGREEERTGMTRSHKPRWLSAGRVDGRQEGRDALGDKVERDALAHALQFSQQAGLGGEEGGSRRQSVPALGLREMRAKQAAADSRKRQPNFAADSTRGARVTELRAFRGGAEVLPAKVRAALATANAPSAFETELYEDDEDDEAQQGGGAERPSRSRGGTHTGRKGRGAARGGTEGKRPGSKSSLHRVFEEKKGTADHVARQGGSAQAILSKINPVLRPSVQPVSEAKALLRGVALAQKGLKRQHAQIHQQLHQKIVSSKQRMREGIAQVRKERRAIMGKKDEVEQLADSVTAAVTHDFQTALDRNGMRGAQQGRGKVAGLGRSGEAENPDDVLRELGDRTRKRLQEINSRPSARISFAAMGGGRVLGAAKFIERQERIRREKLAQGKAPGISGSSQSRALKQARLGAGQQASVNASREPGRLGRLTGPGDVMGAKPWAAGSDTSGGMTGQQRLAATVEAVERRMAEERMKLIKSRGLVGAAGLADAIEDDKHERKKAAELAMRARKVAAEHKDFKQRQEAFATALQEHDTALQKKQVIERSQKQQRLATVAEAGLESFRSQRRNRESASRLAASQKTPSVGAESSVASVSSRGWAVRGRRSQGATSPGAAGSGMFLTAMGSNAFGETGDTAGSGKSSSLGSPLRASGAGSLGMSLKQSRKPRLGASKSATALRLSLDAGGQGGAGRAGFGSLAASRSTADIGKDADISKTLGRIAQASPQNAWVNPAAKQGPQRSALGRKNRGGSSQSQSAVAKTPASAMEATDRTDPSASERMERPKTPPLPKYSHIPSSSSHAGSMAAQRQAQQDQYRGEVEATIGKTAPALRRLLLLQPTLEPVLLTAAARSRKQRLRKLDMQKYGDVKSLDPRDPGTAEVLQLVEEQKEEAARGPFDTATSLRKQMQQLHPQGLAKRQRLEREPPVETGESLRIGKAKATGGVISYADQMRASSMSVTAGLGMMASKLGLSLAEVLLLKRCQAQRKQKEEMTEAEAEMNALHRRKVRQQMQGDTVGAVETEARKEDANESRGVLGAAVESGSRGDDVGAAEGDLSEGDRPKRRARGARGPVLSSKLTRRLAAHVESAITRHAPPEDKLKAAAKAGGLVLSSELANGSVFAASLIDDIKRQRDGILEDAPPMGREERWGAAPARGEPIMSQAKSYSSMRLAGASRGSKRPQSKLGTSRSSPGKRSPGRRGSKAGVLAAGLDPEFDALEGMDKIYTVLEQTWPQHLVDMLGSLGRATAIYHLRVLDDSAAKVIEPLDGTGHGGDTGTLGADNALHDIETRELLKNVLKRTAAKSSVRRSVLEMQQGGIQGSGKHPAVPVPQLREGGAGGAAHPISRRHSEALKWMLHDAQKSEMLAGDVTRAALLNPNAFQEVDYRMDED